MFSLAAVAISFLGLIFLAVLVIVIAVALGKSRNLGRALLSLFIAVVIVLILVVGFARLASFGRSHAVVEHAQVESQARTAVMQAQQQVDEARSRIEAQAAEIEARVRNVNTPGDHILYEDPTTLSTSVTEKVVVPSVEVAAPVIEKPRHDETPTPDASGAGVTVAGTPWTDAVEEHQDFEADVYPSALDAAEALGRRVGERLIDTDYAQAVEGQSIYVWRLPYEGMINSRTVSQQDITVPREMLDAVAAGVRQKVQDPAYVSVEQPPSGDRPNDVKIYVVYQDLEFDNHNKWRKYTVSSSGAVALRVNSPAGEFALSTRFSETPWITDRVGFALQHSKGDWIVSYSAGNHTKQEEAFEEAIHAAADTLLPLARARINRLSASDQQNFSKQMAQNPNWLRDRIADELLSRNNVTDRFAQRFDRPYGTVWREAVLVDADEEAVGQIARSLVQGLDSRLRHQRTTWASFIGLGALIFGTYTFLNMATKGYYTWMLRLAALGGVGGAALLIMNLA